MDGKLVGYKRFTSKKNGKDYCVANVVTDYTPAENSRGNVGAGVAEVFIPDEQYEYLQPEHVGKKLRVNYTILGGRALVDSIEVLK